MISNWIIIAGMWQKIYENKYVCVCPCQKCPSIYYFYLIYVFKHLHLSANSHKIKTSLFLDIQCSKHSLMLKIIKRIM